MSDSLLNQPKSSSLLQASKFQLSFVRLPDVQYFCKKFNVPGGNLPPVAHDMPFKNRPAAGHKLDYETLKIEFLVEEEMFSWEGIHEWLKDLGTETGYQDYKNLARMQAPSQSVFPGYSDATLTVLSTQNNPKIRFRFLDVFPIRLGDIQFDTELSAMDVFTVEAEFGFHYYEIERISG